MGGDDRRGNWRDGSRKEMTQPSKVPLRKEHIILSREDYEKMLGYGGSVVAKKSIVSRERIRELLDGVKK